MNILYLMLDEKKEYALFKIGFTCNIQQRLFAYATSNAGATLINMVHTQSSKKHQLETKCHKEVTKKGYKFITSPLNDSTTEWFLVKYNDPFYIELKTYGFKALKTTANHKIYNPKD